MNTSKFISKFRTEQEFRDTAIAKFLELTKRLQVPSELTLRRRNNIISYDIGYIALFESEEYVCVKKTCYSIFEDCVFIKLDLIEVAVNYHNPII